MNFKVKFIWDEDRWYTKFDELSLTLESGSFDALVERVKIAVPEMVDIIDQGSDSLRFYMLGNAYKSKVEHFGVKPTFDVTEPLIL